MSEKSVPTCDCGKILTTQETTAYGGRCEDCAASRRPTRIAAVPAALRYVKEGSRGKKVATKRAVEDPSR